MALRNIRVEGDEILRKKSKTVKEITPRIKELIEDMKETMHDAGGAGIAGVQVGVLKRVIVVNVGKGDVVLINPKIEKQSENEVLSVEGCLSVPERSGYTRRPDCVEVSALDENGKEIYIKSDSPFFAKALCHEIDHLNGVMYIDKLVTPTKEEIEALKEEE